VRSGKSDLGCPEVDHKKENKGSTRQDSAHKHKPAGAAPKNKVTD
jgi:hypothetical protein